MILIIILQTAIMQSQIIGNDTMLTKYIEAAMKQAIFDKLEDGTYWGEVPACPGTNAHAKTLSGCQEELREVVEEWILQNLLDDIPLPVVADIDLNRHTVHVSSSHQT